MAKLIFAFGAMKSGKSADLIKTAMNYWVRGEEVLIIKPDIDDRDSNKIKTRLGAEIDCQLIPNTYGVISRITENREAEGKKYGAILVDEAQFFSKEIIIELSSLADDGYPVLCWGLKTDFKTELFEGSKTLLELADKILEIKTTCQFCDKKAILNLRCERVGDKLQPVSLDAPVVSIGDEEYFQTCRDCYFKIQEGVEIPDVKSLI